MVPIISDQRLKSGVSILLSFMTNLNVGVLNPVGLEFLIWGAWGVCLACFVLIVRMVPMSEPICGSQTANYRRQFSPSTVSFF